MNANELAEAMEKYSVAGFQYPLCEEFKKAATMLRQFDLAESIIKQQQLEIEALKLQLHTTLTNRDLRTYDGKIK
jgi:sucrose-6-phosphate hydrolase SacC (GH32 family)